MQVIRVISRGGFGVVEEVEKNGERLARKTFDPLNQDPEERAKLSRRFAREVRIQSHIHHPNIIPILAYDLEASPPWFTMPLASESFEQKIVADRANGTTDAGAWQDILAAVEELHRLGYVHRDLKPANVLCVDGNWVLADFGLILPTVGETTKLTGSKSAYGSHFYAAPEQALDFHNVGEGADIFALGCILHDNVCPNPTRVPFAQIDFGGPFGHIIYKCTAVDPGDRFPSISVLRIALFEVFQTPTNDEVVSPEEADLLAAVTADPTNKDVWVPLIQHVEILEHEDRKALLRLISAEMLCKLQVADRTLFRRMMSLICNWVEGSNFDFDYCDVVCDRLMEVFQVSPVRVRCQIVLATLELGVGHNRWHVMHQVRRMIGQNADNDLVDRMLIEIEIDPAIENKIRAIKHVISVTRNRWHSKLGAFLDSRDEAKTEV